jgi:hypothetical protein
MFTDQGSVVKVQTLDQILDQIRSIKIRSNRIDLLKLDIEGSECKVLNSMLDSKIYPKVLCIEFDLYLKGKDKNGETTDTIQRLMDQGYSIMKNENWNITFIKDL